MASIGRFDAPAQAQFMQTYSPIPFQEILQAGLAKQERQDVRLAQIDAAQQAAEQIRYIPGTEDERYVTGTVVPTIQEIADEFSVGRDLTDPNTFRELKRRMNTIDRQRVARIGQSFKGYQTYQDQLAKLRAAGKDAPYLNQLNLTDFTSETGIFSQLPQAALDYGAAAESFFDDLEERSSYDPTTGRIMDAVTVEDVQELAQINLAEFMSAPTGQQAIAAMKYQGAQGSDAEVAYDYLVSRGLEVVRNKLRFAPEYAVKTKKSEFDFPSTYQSEALQLDLPEPVSTDHLQDRDFDDQGNIKEKSRLKPWAPVAAMGSMLMKALENEDYYASKENFKKEWAKKSNYYKKDKQAEKETMVMIRSTYPSLQNPNISDKQALELYGKAVEDYGTQSINLVGANSDVSEEYTRRYVNANIHRDLMLLDGHGKTNYDKDEVLDELGKTEEELLAYINDTRNKTIGGFTHQGPQPGTFFVEVPDKKGTMRRLLFSSDQQIKEATRLSNAVYQAQLTMMPNTIQTGYTDRSGNPIDYKVIPDVDPETGTFTFTILEGAVDQGGNFIPDLDESGQPSVVNITDIQQIERNNLNTLGIF